MEQNRNKVVLNMEHARHIDLAALGILVERITEARQSEGDIRLCNLNVSIRKTFRMVGVAKLIDTYSSQDKAVRSFQVA